MDVFSDRCKALPQGLSFINVWLQIGRKMLYSKARVVSYIDSQVLLSLCCVCLWKEKVRHDFVPTMRAVCLMSIGYDA